MSLRKRGGAWWVDLIAPNGERVRRTTGTANKALAQEFHDRFKSDLWRIVKLGERPRSTWNDAAVRWLKEQSHKATAKEDRAKLRWLDTHLGGKELETINRALIDQITDAKLSGGCSNATVNRVLALVRSILRKCVRDWEWLDRAPAVRMLPESQRRIRYLERQEAQRLLAELPEHLADMAAFSLSTGLRAANVTGLMWSQVDLDRRLAWIHPDQAKARRRYRFRSMRKQSPWSPSSWANTPRTCSATGAAGSRRSARRRGIRRWSARHRRLPVARPAAHLGQLACAGRHALVRLAGDGRLGECRDGEALRAPCRRSSGALCGAIGCFAGGGICHSWHKSVTGPEKARKKHLGLAT